MMQSLWNTNPSTTNAATTSPTTKDCADITTTSELFLEAMYNAENAIAIYQGEDQPTMNNSDTNAQLEEAIQAVRSARRNVLLYENLRPLVATSACPTTDTRMITPMELQQSYLIESVSNMLQRERDTQSRRDYILDLLHDIRLIVRFLNTSKNNATTAMQLLVNRDINDLSWNSTSPTLIFQLPHDLFDLCVSPNPQAQKRQRLGHNHIHYPSRHSIGCWKICYGYIFCKVALRQLQRQNHRTTTISLDMLQERLQLLVDRPLFYSNEMAAARAILCLDEYVNGFGRPGRECDLELNIRDIVRELDSVKEVVSASTGFPIFTVMISFMDRLAYINRTMLVPHEVRLALGTLRNESRRFDYLQLLEEQQKRSSNQSTRTENGKRSRELMEDVVQYDHDNHPIKPTHQRFHQKEYPLVVDVEVLVIMHRMDEAIVQATRLGNAPYLSEDQKRRIFAVIHHALLISNLLLHNSEESVEFVKLVFVPNAGAFAVKCLVEFLGNFADKVTQDRRVDNDIKRYIQKACLQAQVRLLFVRYSTSENIPFEFHDLVKFPPVQGNALTKWMERFPTEENQLPQSWSGDENSDDVAKLFDCIMNNFVSIEYGMLDVDIHGADGQKSIVETIASSPQNVVEDETFHAILDSQQAINDGTNDIEGDVAPQVVLKNYVEYHDASPRKNFDNESENEVVGEDENFEQSQDCTLSGDKDDSNVFEHFDNESENEVMGKDRTFEHNQDCTSSGGKDDSNVYEHFDNESENEVMGEDETFEQYQDCTSSGDKDDSNVYDEMSDYDCVQAGTNVDDAIDINDSAASEEEGGSEIEESDDVVDSEQKSDSTIEVAVDAEDLSDHQGDTTVSETVSPARSMDWHEDIISRPVPVQESTFNVDFLYDNEDEEGYEGEESQGNESENDENRQVFKEMKDSDGDHRADCEVALIMNSQPEEEEASYGHKGEISQHNAAEEKDHHLQSTILSLSRPAGKSPSEILISGVKAVTREEDPGYDADADGKEEKPPKPQIEHKIATTETGYSASESEELSEVFTEDEQDDKHSSVEFADLEKAENSVSANTSHSTKRERENSAQPLCVTYTYSDMSAADEQSTRNKEGNESSDMEDLPEGTGTRDLQPFYPTSGAGYQGDSLVAIATAAQREYQGTSGNNPMSAPEPRPFRRDSINATIVAPDPLLKSDSAGAPLLTTASSAIRSDFVDSLMLLQANLTDSKQDEARNIVDHVPLPDEAADNLLRPGDTTMSIAGSNDMSLETETNVAECDVVEAVEKNTKAESPANERTTRSTNDDTDSYPRNRSDEEITTLADMRAQIYRSNDTLMEKESSPCIDHSNKAQKKGELDLSKVTQVDAPKYQHGNYAIKIEAHEVAGSQLMRDSQVENYMMFDESAEVIEIVDCRINAAQSSLAVSTEDQATEKNVENSMGDQLTEKKEENVTDDQVTVDHDLFSDDLNVKAGQEELVLSVLMNESAQHQPNTDDSNQHMLHSPLQGKDSAVETSMDPDHRNMKKGKKMTELYHDSRIAGENHIGEDVLECTTDEITTSNQIDDIFQQIHPPPKQHTQIEKHSTPQRVLRRRAESKTESMASGTRSVTRRADQDNKTSVREGHLENEASPKTSNLEKTNFDEDYEYSYTNDALSPPTATNTSINQDPKEDDIIEHTIHAPGEAFSIATTPVRQSARIKARKGDNTKEKSHEKDSVSRGTPQKFDPSMWASPALSTRSNSRKSSRSVNDSATNTHGRRSSSHSRITPQKLALSADESPARFTRSHDNKESNGGINSVSSTPTRARRQTKKSEVGDETKEITYAEAPRTSKRLREKRKPPMHPSTTKKLRR